MPHANLSPESFGNKKNYIYFKTTLSASPVLMFTAEILKCSMSSGNGNFRFDLLFGKEVSAVWHSEPLRQAGAQVSGAYWRVWTCAGQAAASLTARSNTRAGLEQCACVNTHGVLSSSYRKRRSHSLMFSLFQLLVVMIIFWLYCLKLLIIKMNSTCVLFLTFLFYF